MAVLSGTGVYAMFHSYLMTMAGEPRPTDLIATRRSGQLTIPMSFCKRSAGVLMGWLIQLP